MDDHADGLDIDALWSRLVAGDRTAARAIVQHFLDRGDAGQAALAADAIGRRLSRETVELIEAAARAPAGEQAALVDRAVEALAAAAVARRLPDLLAADQGVQNLTATGIAGGVALAWTASAAASIFGYQVQTFGSDGTLAATSGILAATSAGTAVTGLTAGDDYLFVVNTLTDTITGSAQVGGRAGLLNGTLPPIGGLTVTPANQALSIAWTVPTIGGTISALLLTVTGGGQQRRIKLLSTTASPQALPTSQTVDGLVDGTPYRVAVQPLFQLNSLLGPVASATAIPGLSGQGFTPQWVALPSDIIRFLDPGQLVPVLDAQRLLATAGKVGGKFTYPYLKALAEKAAGDALVYDREILRLMGMTLDKAGIAAAQLTPALIAAVSELNGDAQEVGGAAAAAPVTQAIAKLSGDLRTLLLFAAVLAWLARSDAFSLWVGFFNALISDIASFDTSFSHVRDFFDSQYASIEDVIKAIAQRELDLANAEIDRAIQPIRAAIAGIIGTSSEKMGDIFASFDLPLTMGQSSSAQDPNLASGDVEVPNVNPLTPALGTLQQSVVILTEQLKERLRSALMAVTGDSLRSAFLDVVLAYFLAPLIIALAVAVAGGPIAAAVLAFIVAVAAEELMHLIAGWLTGVLADKLAELQTIVQNSILAVANAVRDQVPLTSLVNPTSVLSIAEVQLRELRALMPQAFVEDIAGLLGAVRNDLLAMATGHALAAEQALGLQHGTAFDRIGYNYATNLNHAPQLPGTSDTGLLAAAGLLRDLQQAERDGVRVDDGRELTITRRLSLFALLGGIGDPAQAPALALGRFADFLHTGRTSIQLDADRLLDGAAWGAYRALISDVTVVGLSKLPMVANDLVGQVLSVTLSHSGPTWTRIKRNANLAAPPIAMPADFPDRNAFMLAASYRDQHNTSDYVPPLFSPNSLEGRIWSIVASMTQPMTWDNIRAACRSMLPQAIAELGNIRYTALAAATGSSQQAGAEAWRAIDASRATWFSTVPTTTQATSAWLTVELSETSDLITGVRLWPRAGNVGFPLLGDISIAVSDTGADGTFRPVPASVSQQITATGQEAAYFHFAPMVGKFVRITTSALGSIGGGDFAFQLCSVAIETINASPIAIPLSNPTTNWQDPAHPVTNLIGGAPGSYYSSTAFNTATPSASDAPFVTFTLDGVAPMTRVRLTPRSDQNADFPSAFLFQLRGNQQLTFTVTNYAVPGTAPQDFFFPPYQANGLMVQATTLAALPGVANSYALQLARAEVTGYAFRPALIGIAAIGQFVSAQLDAMPWPPTTAAPNPINAAQLIAATLATGQSSAGLSGAAAVAASAWDAAWGEINGHLAKWNGAELRADPDPAAGALNFARLYRPSEPGAAMFALRPADNQPQSGQTLLEASPLAPAADPARVAPFAGLGLGGTVDIVCDGLAAWGLADLILEVTMRASYSAELATALRAGNAQIESQLDRVDAISTASGHLLASAAAVVQRGVSDVTTARMSLRTQRDRVLRAATAAAQLQAGSTAPITLPVTIDGLTFTPSTTMPLSIDRPFAFFGTGGGAPIPGTIDLAFTRDAGAVSLLSQLNMLAITPDMLGVDLALLNSLAPFADSPAAALVGFSIAFVPIRTGGTPFSVSASAIDSSFAPLLPGWVSGQPIPNLLTITPPTAASSVIDLAALWPTTGSRTLSFDCGPAITAGQLYDVIMGISVRSPKSIAHS